MLSRDISSVSVGLVALPLAMASGMASGVVPKAGIYTAIIAGLLISVFGGCKAQTGGPAGAFIVIIYGITTSYGLGGLLTATIGSGVLLFLMGLFRLGSFVRFIPVSIVIGFTNGIAVLIALSQVRDFLGLQVEEMPAGFFHQAGALASAMDTVNPWALAIALASFPVLKAWLKSHAMGGYAYRRWLARMPGTIIVLAFSTLLVSALDLPVGTIGSRFGGIPQELPGTALPDLSWSTVKGLFGPMTTLALLGAIESLL